jgi:hypothetical protein
MVSLRSFLISSISVLPLIFSTSFSQTGQETEQDFLYMRKYIVAIGTVVKDSLHQGKFVPVGSGLLTYTKHDTSIINNIVTARHVINFFRDRNFSSIFIRPSWADTIKITEYFGIEIPLVNSDKSPNVFLYPDEDIDLGCILMLPSYYDSVYVNKFSREKNTIFPFNSMTTPYLGDQVWLCGYPSHVDETINKFMYHVSTFKPGYITWKPSDNIKNEDLYHITLVESNATYGNSGGPVFSLHNKIELVGIAVSIINEIEDVYINSGPYSDPVSKQPLFTIRRSGITIIEKADYVKKLIDYVEKEINKNN